MPAYLMFQSKSSTPPLSLYSPLLWREFFLTTSSKNMLDESMYLQFPWQDNSDALERWTKVS